MPLNNNNEDELRGNVQAALQSFESKPLRDAAISLLDTLGYSSDKTIEIPDSDPNAFLNLLAEHNPDVEINKDKALFDDWQNADILLQLTDEELSNEISLFKDDSVNANLLQSYLFFAIELNQRDYARGKLTAIARQLNRVFPMPVMVFIKHRDLLSIAVINRRSNKRDAEKDVLGKVTIIRDISLTSPHRGHLDILNSFALPSLLASTTINNFDTLHAAWEEIFNVELLNKRFYRELANWYFWALPEVRFPDDMKPAGLTRAQETDYDEKLRATGLIRLLTRLIFCWFLKEKGLIPETLFDRDKLGSILKSLDDDEPTYHQAILQNLFFATLNQRMNAGGKKHRKFARDEGFLKNRDTYGVDNLYRYESLFRDPDAALKEFADIPFLNGGLFKCLDYTDDNGKKIYVDGFSRNEKKRPKIPNRFFFGEGEFNIGAVTGEKRRRPEKVRGLIHILSAYKFTIVENTPIDQEIALDPELLGKVFENLLASYNEETKTTARKQTGSFYTPRPIVDYMVDESLKAHLATVLEKEHGMVADDARTGLDILFTYTEKQHPFEDDEVDTLIKAIDTCKTLDPACGSGAFPMGMLHKLVYILTKLDPDNARWKKTQLDKLDSVPMREDLERTFANNDEDYGRKLYLIENCLYGVDIQPIAIQLSKLRFFISLVCDQKTNKNKRENFGVRPLPNLETRLVAADTLISLDNATHVRLAENTQGDLLENVEIERIKKELQKVRHNHFSVQTRQEGLKLQKKDKKLREQLAQELMRGTGADQMTSHNLAQWDPYDTHQAAAFFEPVWMFDRSIAEGFDLVLGNPPYIDSESMVKANKEYREKLKDYYSFAEGNWDIFIVFIEKGIRLLKKEGVFSYIIPNKLIGSKFSGKTRNELNKLKLVEIRDYSKLNVFVSADVYPITLVLQNLQGTSNDVTRFTVMEEQTSIKSENIVHLNANQEDIFWDIYFLNPNVLMIQMQLGSLKKLGEYSVKISSAATVSEAYMVKEVLVDDETLHGGYKFINTGTIDPYMSLWGKKDTQYIKGKYRFPIIEKHNLESISSKRAAQAKSVKLIVAGMSSSVEAYFDRNGEYVAGKSTTIIIGDEDDLSFICAILNSRVIGFYVRNQYRSLMMSGGYINISQDIIKSIPLPDITCEQGKDIRMLVALMQCAIECSEDVFVYFLQDLIDAFVMECYFHDHMQERDLLFQSDVAALVDKFDPESSESEQLKFLEHFYQTANAPDHPIRNRLLRLTADSPDLLAVIKEHGAA